MFHDLQFLETATIGRFPNYAIVHLQAGIDRIGEVPGVAGVVVEVFHFIRSTIVIAIASVVHTNPQHTKGFAKLSTATGKLRSQYALVVELDIARLRV